MTRPVYARSGSSKTTICKDCGQQLSWGDNKAGKRIPLNEDGTNHFRTCSHKYHEADRKIQATSYLRKHYKKPTHIICLDLETTGLNPDNSVVTQIGAVAVELGSLKIVNKIDIKLQFDTLEANASALAVQDYYNRSKEWDKALTPNDAADALLNWLKQYETPSFINRKGGIVNTTIVCGHNYLNFDSYFLRALYKDTNRKYPFMRELDTMHMAIEEEVFNRTTFYGSYPLDHVRARLGIKRNPDAHDAVVDATITALSLIKMIRTRKEMKIA